MPRFGALVRSLAGLVLVLLLAERGTTAASQGSQSVTGSAAPSAGDAPGQTNTRCHHRQVRLRASSAESVMSQPFMIITVRNTSQTRCSLAGYPTIRVRGRFSPRARAKPMTLRIRHVLYEHLDPGAHRVVIAPAHAAEFYVGTATAYQGGLHLITLTELSITLPGLRRATTLNTSMYATRPEGRPIPFGITALEPGRPPASRS